MRAEVRATLAAAAGEVPGVVRASAYYNQNLAAGEASVRLSRTVPADTGIGWIDTWQVWVALSQDVVSAEKWIDAHLDELVAALEHELVITSITPTEIVVPGGTAVNGLIVEGARER
jgi:hypothetical protein